MVFHCLFEAPPKDTTSKLLPMAPQEDGQTLLAPSSSSSGGHQSRSLDFPMVWSASVAGDI